MMCWACLSTAVLDVVRKARLPLLADRENLYEMMRLQLPGCRALPIPAPHLVGSATPLILNHQWFKQRQIMGVFLFPFTMSWADGIGCSESRKAKNQEELQTWNDDFSCPKSCETTLPCPSLAQLCRKHVMRSECSLVVKTHLWCRSWEQETCLSFLSVESIYIYILGAIWVW